MASSGSTFTIESPDPSAAQPSKCGLFANVPSLQELANNRLCNTLGSVQAIEAYLSQQNEIHGMDIRPMLEETLEGLKSKVQTLHTHVVRGEQKAVEEFLQDNIGILPILLKSISTVETYAKGMQAHVVVQGTAFRMALGAEDVSQHGTCDLILLNSPPFLANIASIPIRSRAAYIRSGNKLFYVDKTNNECTEIILKQEALKKFDIALQPKYDLIKLSEEQLNRIISLTGHIHEESMAQMLKRYLRMLPDGEKEIAKQRQDQFPAGWEETEKIKQQEDSAALKRVIQAISTSGADDNCETALQVFRNYLEPQDIIKTGKHFNARLLIEALNYYHKNYYDFCKREDNLWNNICWSKVIGYIQRFLPACYAQAFAQGLYFIADQGEKLSRKLNFRFKIDFHIYPLDTDPALRLGHDFGLSAGHGSHTIEGFRQATNQEMDLIQLCQTKNIALSHNYAQTIAPRP